MAVETTVAKIAEMTETRGCWVDTVQVRIQRHKLVDNTINPSNMLLVDMLCILVCL